MRYLIRIAALLVVAWGTLLFSGYGILIGSHENAAGLGLQCRYLTARQMVNAQFIHSDSGLIGMTACPVLRKSETVVDNG
ncbi:YobH family protein [Cronobacter dublinensis]